MRGYTQLTQEERYQIYALKEAGHSQKEIAMTRIPAAAGFLLGGDAASDCESGLGVCRAHRSEPQANRDCNVTERREWVTGPPTRFPGNPAWRSANAGVLRPGEYHRVTPIPQGSG